MKRHLTDASVQRLKPPRDKDLEVFDLGYPGLALRVGYGGAKSFILFYRYAGKLRRETLGRWPETSLAAARERWRRTREAIARGDDPSGANGKVPALAFEAVVEEWLRRDVGAAQQSLERLRGRYSVSSSTIFSRHGGAAASTTSASTTC